MCESAGCARWPTSTTPSRCNPSPANWRWRRGAIPRISCWSSLVRRGMIDLAARGVDYANYGDPVEVYPVDTGRLSAVVRLAAEKAHWGRRMPRGRGLGIAAHRSFLSYVATVVEVEVSRAGNLVIPSVHVAIDAGTVVNPDHVRAQCEGGSVYGLSCAPERRDHLARRGGGAGETSTDSRFHGCPRRRNPSTCTSFPAMPPRPAWASPPLRPLPPPCAMPFMRRRVSVSGASPSPINFVPKMRETGDFTRDLPRAFATHEYQGNIEPGGDHVQDDRRFRTVRHADGCGGRGHG